MYRDPEDRRRYQRRYYRTAHWRKLRAKTQARYALKRRMRILERDHFTCYYCHNAFDASELHVDHVFPVALGGKDTDDNRVAACHWCNQSKCKKPICSQCRTWVRPERVDANTIRCVNCGGLNTFPKGIKGDDPKKEPDWIKDDTTSDEDGTLGE